MTLTVLCASPAHGINAKHADVAMSELVVVGNQR